MTTKIVEGRLRESCDHCGWIHYTQWKVSAGVCIEKDGKLLLIQRGFDPWKGCWHMPAGYVEMGEDPSAAAEREALEETGFIVKAEKLDDVYLDFEDPRGNVLVLIYLARILGGKLSCTPESPAAGFFSSDDITLLPIAGTSGMQAIQAWKNRGHTDVG